MMRLPVACRKLGVRAAAAARAQVVVVPKITSSLGFQRCFSSDAEKVGRQRLWRWGATSAGKLSQQDVVEVANEPTLMEEFSGVTSAACGSGHSAFVTDGKLYTFGSNKWQQLGREADRGASSIGTGADPDVVTFEDAEGNPQRVISAALGAFHSCAVTEGGKLWTWGWGGSFWHGAGALGHSGKEGAERPVLVEQFVEEGEEVRQVACGHQHTIILTAEGRLYATGKGDFGLLGRGDSQDEPEFEEIEYFHQANDSILDPSEAPLIIKIDAGRNFSAALSQNGEMWVWGRNDHGQLGLGEEAMGDMYSAERYPRLVRSLPIEGHQIVDMACGENHAVCLTASGALYEWGNRTWLEPHPVSLPARYQEGLKDIVKVAAGDKFSFALTKDGAVYVWGQKSSGCLALGEGPEAAKNVVEPTLIPAEAFGHQKVLDIFASKWRVLVITQEDAYAH